MDAYDWKKTVVANDFQLVHFFSFANAIVCTKYISALTHSKKEFSKIGGGWLQTSAVNVKFNFTITQEFCCVSIQIKNSTISQLQIEK